jgi:hypothetical protein
MWWRKFSRISNSDRLSRLQAPNLPLASLGERRHTGKLIKSSVLLGLYGFLAAFEAECSHHRQRVVQSRRVVSPIVV